MGWTSYRITAAKLGLSLVLLLASFLSKDGIRLPSSLVAIGGEIEGRGLPFPFIFRIGGGPEIPRAFHSLEWTGLLADVLLWYLVAFLIFRLLKVRAE